MARILSLDECPASLKAHLIKSLRTLDEAVLLPSSSRCDASGTYKNVTFRLDAREADVPIQIFSPEWGAGVSAIRVEGAWVNRLISDPTARHAALRKLKTAIPSECFDSNLQVGPALDGDESDRDKADWKAGFDGPGCFVGLFCAEHSHAPDPTKQGMNRCHSTTYLVCKAGAGQAGATFHSRLVASLRTGASLGRGARHRRGRTRPGPGRRRCGASRAPARATARASSCSPATRSARPMMDSVPDQSSCGRYRSAVTHLDVAVNHLRKIEDTHHGARLPVLARASTRPSRRGCMSMSNLADGVVLFLVRDGRDPHRNLRNDAHSTLPYASPRLVGDRELISRVVTEYKQRGANAHPDAGFVRDRFVWRNRKFNANDADLEPLALWGSHDTEQFFAKFARELGVAKSQVVRLRPVAVCASGLEGGKLRAALRSIPTAK